jgi:aryl-alcohol dehydrogenase-like predicted oxidoreductase
VTERSEADRRTTGFLYRNTESDTAIIDAVGAVANKHGVNRAQVALAWLRSKPPVVAPLVGASKLSRIDDAIASLALALDADDIAALEGPYRPQVDTQNVTDNALIEATTRAMGMIAHRPPKWGASGVAR